MNVSNLVVVLQKARETAHEMVAETEMMIEVVGAGMTIEAEIVTAISAVEMIVAWMTVVWTIAVWTTVEWTIDVVETIAVEVEMTVALEVLGKLAQDLGVIVNVKGMNNGLLEGEMMMVQDVTLMIAEMTVAMTVVTIVEEMEVTGVLVRETCLQEVLQGKIGVTEMIAVVLEMTDAMIDVVTIVVTWTEVAWIAGLIAVTEETIAVIVEVTEEAGDLDLEMIEGVMTDVTIAEVQEVHQEMIVTLDEEMIDVGVVTATGVMIGVQVQGTCLQEDLLEMIEEEEEKTDVNVEIHPNVNKDQEIKKVEMVGLQSANVELTYELFVVHYWCMI